MDLSGLPLSAVVGVVDHLWAPLAAVVGVVDHGRLPLTTPGHLSADGVVYESCFPLAVHLVIPADEFSDEYEGDGVGEEDDDVDEDKG